MHRARRHHLALILVLRQISALRWVLIRAYLAARSTAEACPYGVLAPSEEATAILFRGKVFCAAAGLELPERAAVEDKWWHVAGGEVVYAQEDDVVIPSGQVGGESVPPVPAKHQRDGGDTCERAAGDPVEEELQQAGVCRLVRGAGDDGQVACLDCGHNVANAGV
jgi:hypothetical protein